jgi:hypothetical protein
MYFILLSFEQIVMKEKKSRAPRRGPARNQAVRVLA